MGSLPDAARDEALEHLQSCVGFLVGHHVSTCVDHVVGEIVVVDGDPAFQAAAGIEHWPLLLDHWPADLLQVLLSLVVGHHCIDVAGEEHHLESCGFEGLEEGHSGSSLLVLIVDLAVAGCPLGGSHVQLRLHLWVVQVLDQPGVVSVAVRFVVVEGDDALVEHGVAVGPASGLIGLG